MAEREKTKTRKIIKFIILNFIVVIFLFVFIEGLSSMVMFSKEVAKKESVAESLYTKYDNELGWVNIPNVHIKDMYGPGVYLKTNSQGFRNSEDFSIDVPDNKVRVICSGDSFTLGYGVDNDHTWCQQLVTIDNKLQTVNMGQGGYGVDQAYLWYKRDGKKLEHDIQIFAFITIDFLRMQSDRLLGHGKPVLRLKDGEIVTKGIPVAKRPSYISWLLRNQWKIKNLNSVRLLQNMVSKKQVLSVVNYEQSADKLHEVVLKVFSDLRQINEQKNSTLVLVYLPTASYRDEPTKRWRQFLQDEARKNNLLFIDLYDDFLELPFQKVEKLFIRKDDLDYAYAAGHYTAEGNAYIADILYKKMLLIPELSGKLHK